MDDTTVHRTEEWRPVQGWPYEVSDHGRLRRSISARTSRAKKMLTPTRHSIGYQRVRLTHGGASKCEYIHRLVCTAFHGNPPSPAHEVGHRNGCCSDNRAANLRWVTAKENRQDEIDRNVRPAGEGHPRSAITDQDVADIRRLGAGGVSHRVIGVLFGVGRPHVSRIIRGEARTRTSSRLAII